MNLRRLAERMSRGVVLRRNLPPEFHRLPMYVSPEAGLRYWRSLDKVDPSLLRMVRELVKPGSTHLLQTSRRIVWCEVAPQNSDAVAALLRNHRYDIYEADQDATDRKPVRRAPWSTLAVPTP